jgi:hypothetical protein
MGIHVLYVWQRNPSLEVVRINASRFFKQLFRSSVGQIRISKSSSIYNYKWVIELRIEGPPAHDPSCREQAIKQFTEHFLFRGFGTTAHLWGTEVSILAGDQQDGKPRDQLIVLPTISMKELLNGKSPSR